MGRAGGGDPRLRGRKGSGWPDISADQGKALPARIDHRRDRVGRRRCSGGEHALCLGLEIALRLPQSCSLRLRLGKHGLALALLHVRSPIYPVPPAILPPPFSLSPLPLYPPSHSPPYPPPP